MSGPAAAWFRREGLALLTDFYELTMMAGQWREGRMDRRVSFDYFFRALPPHTGFAVSAGLGLFLDYLENLRFDDSDLDYLRSLGVFDDDFLAYLRDFTPQCTVRAVPEGSLVFPFEPAVQVEASILEAQLLETALLNFMNYSTLIATKAARVCLAAEGEPVMEFGLRRAHGPDGGVTGSRAAHIGGCTSTSNVLAGKAYGVPVSGTHAHSWVMSFPTELEAFRAFARQYPERCVLLVDTYDTIKSGVPNAIRVFQEMRERGMNVRPAIRLDSGDLAKLSKLAHKMMAGAGFDDPLIIASNDLDEDLIADLKRQGAKINGWGVGTHLITAFDCPALGGVYKLTAIQSGNEWQARMKLSSNAEKATDPGRKQMLRCFDAEDRPLGDIISLEEHPPHRTRGTLAGRLQKNPHLPAHIEGVARVGTMLRPVFADGRRTAAPEPVDRLRARAQAELAALPEEYKRLRNPEIYRVLLSEELGRMKDRMMTHPELA